MTVSVELPRALQDKMIKGISDLYPPNASSIRDATVKTGPAHCQMSPSMGRGGRELLAYQQFSILHTVVKVIISTTSSRLVLTPQRSLKKEQSQDANSWALCCPDRLGTKRSDRHGCTR